jgi:DNA modification methylase
MANALYYGDNLDVLRGSIASDSVDLIYLDPPFNSQASYNVLFKGPSGKMADAQIEAFEDTWHWGEGAERGFSEVLASPYTQAAELLRAMRSFLGENDMMAYLAMMAVRLIELHRVLKPTGSLYLHCDPTASHYLKVLLDAIFEKMNFRNEIIWKRTSSHHNPKRWGPVHDTLLFYTRSNLYTWNKVFQVHDEGYLTGKYKYADERGRYRLSDLTAAGIRHGDSGDAWRGFNPTPLGRHWGVPAIDLDEASPDLTTQEKLDRLDRHGFIYWTPGRSGKPGFPQFKRYLTIGLNIQDVIVDTPPINSMARERLGYPTQKPLTLLERVIQASSNEGDLVLDPFCGCGTTIHAAQKLGRQWIGIDVTHLAISLIERRLKDAFPGIAFDVHGTPKDLESALDLARRDKYQFQWWAVSLVDARPYGGKKKGADGGIDGILFFRSDRDKTEKALVSVKGGENVGVGMVRELISVVDREKAAIGVLISLALPTRAMEREASAAGLYETPFEKVPKIQIITLAELFQGIRPRVPRIDVGATFRTAKRPRRNLGSCRMRIRMPSPSMREGWEG